MSDIEKKMLDKFVANEMTVVVIMLNGFQMRGIIKAYNDDAIQFRQNYDKDDQLVYKKAVSTIKVWHEPNKIH